MARDYVKVKFCRNYMSENWTRNINLGASWVLADNVKLQYLSTILLVKALLKFETLCVQVISMTMTHLNQVMLVLGK